MRILIVSRDPSAPTETSHIDRLRAIWKDAELQAMAISDFSSAACEGYDALVISGCYDSAADVPLPALSALTSIIMAPALPVLGIAWGFQVVCLAFGEDLEDGGVPKEAGAPRLVPTSKGESLFQGSDPLRVTEGDRWCLEEVPRGWVALATSESGVEALQSKAKPVYALQQYPDDFTYESDGKLVYQNLLSFLQGVKNKK